MFFRNESYYDGAVGVTQWLVPFRACAIRETQTVILFLIRSGIPPGDAFTYEFTVTEQTGTYWVHAHASVSASLRMGGVHSENLPRDNM